MSEPKIEPCPYCQSKTNTNNYGGESRWVILCSDFGCHYSSGDYETEAEAIAAHNKVSRNNAAAPNLLEAAEMAVEYADGDLVAFAKAALAKAKGEHQ